jgi:hypothetical protein
MREWNLTYADPMAPRIAADARSGRTVTADDQVWQLHLGRPDEPALSLETRYGGRVGIARLVPIWFAGRRQIYESQGYHNPPVLTHFAPDYLRLRAGLTLHIALTYEFWTMESQAVGGRFTCHNTSDQPQDLRLDLSVQAVREEKTLQMFFLALENNQVALQMGRLPNLQPVLLLDGAQQLSSTQARLSRTLTIAPGDQTAIRWVLASLPDRDASLMLAYKWLSDPGWDAAVEQIDARADAAPQVDTGHAEWDSALAWSQQLIVRSFLGATGSLPHPSFVESRKPNQGFAVSGVHTSGFAYPWGGQTVPHALHIAAPVALAAPDLAKGMVRNFLAVQRDDGWIDAKPGLDGQRVNVLAAPMLASLAYEVYHITRDKAFLADCLDGLLAFFERWFKPDVDHDRDGVPEWTQPGQGAFADGPTLAQGRRWAQGIDITTIEAPDLLAYLIREAQMILRIAQVLDRGDVEAQYTPRCDKLKAALGEFWNDDSGVFFYRDRDSHACPDGETLFSGKGDESFDARTVLARPSRLIVRASGGLSHKPKMECTIEGTDTSGKPANETVPGAAFDWYRGMGSATTKTVWREIKHLKFSGLSRVFKVETSAVDLSRHDQALFAPLWTDALSDEQIERVVAQLTDPDQYWREYGVCSCPASDAAYDATFQNGCGGLWPDWNARLAAALIEHGYTREAADLFKRVLAAQTRSLQRDQNFRALYNPDTGEGMGDTDTITGAVAWGWFAALFGAWALEPGLVVIAGPFAFADESMRWTQHGVTIERSAKGTSITFPSGHVVKLDPDATPQIVHDPKIKRRKTSKKAAPPAAEDSPAPADPVEPDAPPDTP